MVLTKESYTVTRETMQIVIAALADNITGWCPDEDDDFNNEDIMAALDALKSEVEGQEATPHEQT